LTVLEVLSTRFDDQNAVFDQDIGIRAVGSTIRVVLELFVVGVGHELDVPAGLIEVGGVEFVLPDELP